MYHDSMHTFRFNPVFQQWVLLGTSYAATPAIEERNLLDVGRGKKFAAASHPRQPFILEPDSKAKDHDDLLYAGKPPVGEYELLLYAGKDPLYTWDHKEWDGWLQLAQQRISQARGNPHLHHLSLTVHTGALKAVEGNWQRVGDLIATSHPVCGMATLIDKEMAHKMLAKEGIFVVQHDSHGSLIVPSAPTHQHEVWYLPAAAHASLGDIDSKERASLAKVLASLMTELKAAYPHEEFLLTFHTALLGSSSHHMWWLQVHQADSAVELPLPVRPLPELFVRKLQDILS